MPAVRTASYVAEAAKYMRDVVSGKQVACRWVRMAVDRQMRDLERFDAEGSPYFFDDKSANTVCEYIEHFRHVKGVWARAGSRIALEPWQCFVVCVTFGWKRTSDGARRFRVVYIEVPRKNGKTSLTSAIGLYLLAADGEHGAHVVAAATTKEQARLLFGDSQAMARKEPQFLEAYGVEVTAHAISQLETSSKFEAISSEDHSLDGYNISGALIDELHAHRDRSVWDVLETATGSRLQPIVWAITTAGTNRAGICYQQHLHVRDILTGRVADESYFGCIWTIDEGDDPFAESSMRKANPNWGVSIFPENFRQIAARAQSMPSAQTAYFTKHLCLWSNSDHQWLPNGSWEKCADTSLLIDAFAGEDCYVGIDLAQRADLAAMAFLFPPAGDRLKWTVFCKFYLPQETVERAENSHFQGWERLGRLTVTDGAVIDYDAILDDLEAACERFDVREIASDPWQNVPFMSSLEKRGVRVPRVDVRPTIATLSPVMKELEGFIISGKIQHDNDPILGWCFSNVVAKTDSRDNIQPIKEAPERKIDGVVATMIAMDRALRALTTPDFEKRGLWSV